MRLIEDTRYQAQLDAKVEELVRVYRSPEFMQDIYRTLARDQEFVNMLRSMWQIELLGNTIQLYRVLVMYRRPLLPTDSGYHVPSTEEVIAEIKAFFDPAHLSNDAIPLALGETGYSQKLRADILSMLRDTRMSFDDFICDANDNIQGLLLQGLMSYIHMLSVPDPSSSRINILGWDYDLTVPLEISEAISKASAVQEISRILMNCVNCDAGAKIEHYLGAWFAVHKCLEKPEAGPACECPFVYFFVKYCLTHDLGVPKLALDLYDRMNMQMSREFIRCANPSCEHSKLDKSTGKIKFKKCSRHAVIYCSRECQVAHYPEHKRLCREHVKGSYL